MGTHVQVPEEGPEQTGEARGEADGPRACRTVDAGERSPPEGPSALNLKILVDCSRSMQGNGIEAAKRVLQALLPCLGPRDRFSLSRFGSRVEHRSRGTWAATLTARRAALRWINGLKADLGGTGLEAALESTFAQSPAGEVLVLMDGETDAIDSIIQSARASGHRLFLIGLNAVADRLGRFLGATTEEAAAIDACLFLISQPEIREAFREFRINRV